MRVDRHEIALARNRETLLLHCDLQLVPSLPYLADQIFHKLQISGISVDACPMLIGPSGIAEDIECGQVGAVHLAEKGSEVIRKPYSDRCFVVCDVPFIQTGVPASAGLELKAVKLPIDRALLPACFRYLLERLKQLIGDHELACDLSSKMEIVGEHFAMAWERSKPGAPAVRCKKAYPRG